MDNRALHPGLAFRLDLLATRIASLKLVERSDTGIAKIDDKIEIAALEQQYERLQNQFDALEREGSGFRATLKSGLAQVAYDLRSSVDAFLNRLEGGYRPGGRESGR